MGRARAGASPLPALSSRFALPPPPCLPPPHPGAPMHRDDTSAALRRPNGLGTSAGERAGVDASDAIIDAEASAPAVAETSPPRARWCDMHRLSRIKQWMIKYHLVLMLILGTIVGAAWPLPGARLGNAQLGGIEITSTYYAWSTISSLLVSGIFFVNGLQFKTDAARQALRSRFGIALGLFEILLLTPLLGFAVAAAPGLSAPLRLGIALFQLMPTTLSAGPLIVGMAGGSAPLGMLLTVLANLIAVGTLAFSVPLMFQVLTGSVPGPSVFGATAVVPPLPIVLNLVFTLLIPLCAGKGVQDWVPHAAAFVAGHSLLFKLLPSLFLSMIPWMTLSQSANLLWAQAPGDIAAACFAAIAAHLLLLAVAFSSTSPVLLQSKIAAPDRKACVIMGAQKSLPVAITVLVGLNLGPAAGLATVPLVISQLFQTIFDSFLAVQWANTSATLASTSVPETAAEASPMAAPKSQLQEGAASSPQDSR